MSKKNVVIDYLKAEPRFRERRNKDMGLVNLLLRRYPALRTLIDHGEIGKDTVVAMVQDYASMDRAWRQALERDPSLRGADYGEKEELEAQAQRALGYGPPTGP